MSDTRYILFTGSMQPKNPMLATEDKIKEIVGAGFRQGKDFDIVSEKVLKDKLGKRGGGMMNMDEMIRPLGYAAGGPIPPEPEKTGMLSGLLSLIKDRLVPEQREDGGAEYNKIFNFLWNQGFDSQQIDDIINRRVNQEDIVPSRKNLEEKFKG